VFVYLRSTCDASNFQSKREEQMFYDWSWLICIT
jgi:hypothetical protein